MTSHDSPVMLFAKKKIFDLNNMKTIIFVQDIFTSVKNLKESDA